MSDKQSEPMRTKEEFLNQIEALVNPDRWLEISTTFFDLSRDSQIIFCDDLLTAIEHRLKVFARLEYIEAIKSLGVLENTKLIDIG
jgi:hypothetical protein